MDSLPLPDGRTTVSGGERVLLSFHGERDRSLLRSWLDSEFEVVEGSPDSVESFDLCLVDERGYDAFEETFAERRAAVTPTLLPVLVLASEPRAVPRHADDVVVLPTRTELLGSRIRSLLRTRRLTRQLSLFRRAIDEATIGVSIALAEADQPLVYVNEAFEHITGYDREEILGRNCRFLQGADTDPEPVAELRAAIDEERATNVVLRNYRGDGTPFWNEVSVTPVRTAGEVTHFVGFQQEVTDQVELERSLREERDLLEGVLDSSPVAIVLLDETGEMARANDRAREILGIDHPDRPGRQFDDEDWDITDPTGEPIDAEDLPFARALRGEEVWGYQHTVQVDGERRYLSVNAVPHHDETEIVGVVATIQDITDRVRREHELEQYEAIVDSMREAAWIIDTDGRISFVNEQAVEGIDLEAADVVGMPLSDFSRSFPDDGTLDRYLEYVAELLAGERTEAKLTFEPKLPGRRRAIEVSLAPLLSDGRPMAVVGVSRDVTERVERDRRISVLDRVLRHNLRNKLNVVLANARDLTATGDAESAALASAIETAAEELLSLSDTARRFESTTRPSEGSVGRIEVSAHVAHVVEESALVHDADVTMDECEETWALAHESLELAIQELVENAIVHADADPTVSVSVTDRPEADVVEVTVTDEGPGLPEMERAVLLSGAETPLEHMEGLGLWFSNWAVTASGGSVSVAENEPHGTVVTITLPRA